MQSCTNNLEEWENEFLKEFAAFVMMCRLQNPENLIPMSRIRLTDMLWNKAKEYQEGVCNPYNEELQNEWWERNRE